MKDAGLPGDARIGRVTLRVADLERARGFYGSILGVEEGLVTLVEDRRAPVRPPRTTGLFHFALLVPSRRDLAQALRHLLEEGWGLRGAADHAVSESLYLADPEGNGIEIYADRPRPAWTREGGDLRMTTDPLDLDGLAAAAGPSEPWRGLPRGTVMGHIHLEGTDLDVAEGFYAGAVGFDVTVRGYPGARFLAAGGYHHHLAVNVWNRAQRRAPEGALGLLEYEIIVPGREDREALGRRLDAGGAARVEDPFGVGVRIVGS